MRAMKRYIINTILTINHLWPCMHRWLSRAGVKVASEKNQRILSKQLITTQIASEVAPFTHQLKKGGKEVKKAAMAYIPDLVQKITELLEQHAR